MLRNAPRTRADLIALARADYRADLVSIDARAIHRHSWPIDALSPMTITLDPAFAEATADALAFLVLMTSVNYQFWDISDSGEFRRYHFHGESGARALWRAFSDAWGQGCLTRARFTTAALTQGVSQLFGDIPSPGSRQEILNELLENSERLDSTCQALAQRIAARREVLIEDAALLADRFPLAFGDPYLKKGQLALSMFAAHLRGPALAVCTSDLTAFADYQVPRVLRALGILEYTQPLASAVDRGVLIPMLSSVERAIRAATILACEDIAKATGATPADVDNLLWQSQGAAGQALFHRTRTTWY
jgi:hypothetical protein